MIQIGERYKHVLTGARFRIYKITIRKICHCRCIDAGNAPGISVDKFYSISAKELETYKYARYW